eukprot:XP_008647116.2 proline-rich protein 36 [Zea mays]
MGLDGGLAHTRENSIFDQKSVTMDSRSAPGDHRVKASTRPSRRRKTPRRPSRPTRARAPVAELARPGHRARQLRPLRSPAPVAARPLEHPPPAARSILRPPSGMQLASCVSLQLQHSARGSMVVLVACCRYGHAALFLGLGTGNSNGNGNGARMHAKQGRLAVVAVRSGGPGRACPRAGRRKGVCCRAHKEALHAATASYGQATKQQDAKRRPPSPPDVLAPGLLPKLLGHRGPRVTAGCRSLDGAPLLLDDQEEEEAAQAPPCEHQRLLGALPCSCYCPRLYTRPPAIPPRPPATLHATNPAATNPTRTPARTSSTTNPASPPPPNPPPPAPRLRSRSPPPPARPRPTSGNPAVLPTASSNHAANPTAHSFTSTAQIYVFGAFSPPATMAHPACGAAPHLRPPPRPTSRKKRETHCLRSD